MKAFLYLTTLLTIISCSQNKQKIGSEKDSDSDGIPVSVESNKYYDVQDINCNTFNSFKKSEKSDFIADTLRFLKHNKELILPIENGRSITFTDTLTDVPDTSTTVNLEEFRQYKYLGHFSKINFYLVKRSLYEEINYFLIDMQTGIQTEIGGFPKLSLDQEYLMNINEMGGYDIYSFGYQIWKFDKTSRTLTEISTLEQDKWMPIDFIWIDKKTALIKLISLESKDIGIDNYDMSKDCVSKKIIMK